MGPRTVWSTLGRWGLFAFALGCNALTGADEIDLGDETDTSEGGSTSSNATSVTTGQSSGGESGLGGQNSSSSGGATASAGGGTVTGPVVCDYPSGPYGRQAGLILDPTFSVQAYVEGSNAPTTVTAADLFDCQGQGGTKALLITTSQLT
jgi:hypothetical protein